MTDEIGEILGERDLVAADRALVVVAENKVLVADGQAVATGAMVPGQLKRRENDER